MSTITNSNNNIPSIVQTLIPFGGGAATGFSVGFLEAWKKHTQSGQTHAWQVRDITNGTVPFSKAFQYITKGTMPFALSVTASTGISTFWEAQFTHLPGYNDESLLWKTATASLGGVMAGIISSSIAENTIIYMQFNPQLKMLQAVSKMIQKEGWRRPFIGVKLYVGREIGFSAVWQVLAKAAYDKTLEVTESKPLGLVAKFGAATLGALATQPFDTTATRIQHYVIKHGTVPSVTFIVKKTLAEYGWQGLFTGLPQRWALFVACTLLIPTANKALESSAGYIYRGPEIA